MASIGNELKDGFKQTNNWLTNNVQFLTDIEQFHRQKAIIEKDYATNLQKLTAEFLKRKANRTTSVSVGDTPAITPGSLEAASLTTWNEILSNNEIISQNHLNYSKELNIKISDQILALQRQVENFQSKLQNFHDNQLVKQKEEIFDQVTKAKKHYDEACQSLEKTRSKLEQNKSSSKYTQKYNEKEIDMNIAKNDYLIKINIANRIKDKFYYQDLPEVLDLYQDLNEFKTQQLNLILQNDAHQEISLMNKNIKNINNSIAVIDENKPILDSQMFIKHNAVGDWNEPQDFNYIPSSIWHDDDTFITKENELTDLKKRLIKSKQVLHKYDDSIENLREQLTQLSASKKSLKDGELSSFDFKKSVDLVSTYLLNLSRFITEENKKVEAQVEIETIENNVVDVDLSVEGLTIETKKTGFLKRLKTGINNTSAQGKKNRTTEKLVSVDDTFDDSQSIQSSATHTTSHNFKLSSLLRSRSIASNHTVATTQTTTLRGTALYDYQAQGEDEVDISVNESFEVVEPDDGSGWTKIYKDGQEGLVPTSYINVTTTTTSSGNGGTPKKKGPEVKPRKTNTKKIQYCVAKYDYEAEEPNELSISAGDKIIVLTGDEGGWTYGEQSDGSKGLFPSSYVDLI